jgi:serine/threonine protein kinase
MFENGDDRVTTKAGTNFYFSPEVCKGASYSGMAADVWACGVVLFKMATKKLPFTTATDNLQELFNIILTAEPDYQEFSQYDPSLLDLMKGIFIKDPKLRLNIA